jgi:predicted GNAT family acetyltransferase
MPKAPGKIIDNAAKERFEPSVGGEVAIAAYEREGDVLVFTRTEVPPEQEGQGVKTRLIAGALADVRARHLKIAPACSFVRAYVAAHPADQDLPDR